MRNSKPVLIAAALVAALAQPAVSLTIDSFEVGTFNFTDDATTVNATFAEQSSLATSDVVGGVRLVRVLASAAPLGSATAAAALVNVPNVDDGAALSIVAVPDGEAEFEFIYDGIANGVADSIGGNLNLDLSAFTTLDVALTAVAVTGFVKVSISSSGPNGFDDQTLALVNGVLSFPLAGFSVNLASIEEIKVALSGIQNGEVPIVTSISAGPVPEPGTGLLLAAGLVGLGVRRRRASC